MNTATPRSTDQVILGRTNTVPLGAGTPYQLIVQSTGNTNFFILNSGPGNLYLRYGQPPATGDPSSITIPASLGRFVLFPVTGNDGVWALADQTGSISVLVLDNPLPNTVTIDGNAGGGGGQSQTPWLSNINAAQYSLQNVNDVIGTGNWLYLRVNANTQNLFLALNAGIPDTRCYGTFSHYVLSTNTPNIALSEQGLALLGIAQYADLATAQAALGAGTKIVWCDLNNALYVT